MSGSISDVGYTPPSFSSPAGPLQTLSNLYAQQQGVAGGDQAVSTALSDTVSAALSKIGGVPSGTGLNAAFNQAFTQTVSAYGPSGAGGSSITAPGSALRDTQKLFELAQRGGNSGEAGKALEAFRSNLETDTGLPAKDLSLGVLNSIANQVVSQFGTTTTQGSSLNLVG